MNETYSPEEMQEMLQIRHKIEDLQLQVHHLQVQYNTLASKGAPVQMPLPQMPDHVPPMPTVYTQPAPQPAPGMPTPIPIAQPGPMPVAPPVPAPQPTDTPEQEGPEEAPPPVATLPSTPAQPDASWTIKDRIINILAYSEDGMTFPKLYAALEEDGCPMPRQKPKLVIRKALYNKTYFDILKGGVFLLAEGVAPPAPASSPASGTEAVPIPEPVPEPEPESSLAEAATDNTPAPAPIPTAVLENEAAETDSGRRSIRERVSLVLNQAARPLSFDDVYAGLREDGNSLPLENPESVVKNVLNNKTLFQCSEGELYTPVPGT